MNLFEEEAEGVALLDEPKDSDHCLTPDWLYKALDTEFAFDLDPCPLARRPETDGLKLDWNGRRVFCNPPYSSILPWVEKALSSNALTVFLVPARFNAYWCTMLRDARSEFRHFSRGFSYTNIDGGKSAPLAGSMLVIVRRWQFQT